MLKNSPEASNSEWMSALIPLGLVGLCALDDSRALNERSRRYMKGSSVGFALSLFALSR